MPSMTKLGTDNVCRAARQEYKCRKPSRYPISDSRVFMEVLCFVGDTWVETSLLLSLATRRRKDLFRTFISRPCLPEYFCTIAGIRRDTKKISRRETRERKRLVTIELLVASLGRFRDHCIGDMPA